MVSDTCTCMRDSSFCDRVRFSFFSQEEFLSCFATLAFWQNQKQEDNPLLGEFRMYAALKQLGITVSPRTCGRILAENRRLYGIKPKPGEPHKPKPHPFKATARHER